MLNSASRRSSSKCRNCCVLYIITTLIIFSLFLLGQKTTHSFTVTTTISSTKTTNTRRNTNSHHNNHFFVITNKNNQQQQQQSSSLVKLNESTGLDDVKNPTADYDALLKYHGAISIQMALICGIFKGLDYLLLDVTQIADSIPTLALFPLFYFLALKSRSLNPLDNRRPDLQKAVQQKGGGGDESDEPTRGFNDRVMPSWTPPGVVFPIMWLLIIGPIRAYSSALVYQANGHHLFDPAILALMFHLAVGDIWNTMNNSERRFGASVTGVLCVTASALNAAYQYYTVDELAGNLLGSLPMIWFAVATSLITATWKINPDPTTGELEPLYPIVRKDQKTTFAWFNY